MAQDEIPEVMGAPGGPGGRQGAPGGARGSWLPLAPKRVKKVCPDPKGMVFTHL